MPPGGAAALAAGLAAACHARAEAALRRKRGKDRTHPAKARWNHPRTRLAYPHLVIAEVIRQRFSLPVRVIAASTAATAPPSPTASAPSATHSPTPPPASSPPASPSAPWTNSANTPPPAAPPSPPRPEPTLPPITR